jgi:alkanesulfonate monooxygenase SsuD/methylene tetrahydromethanopterin reductase-like flavin-dependent oxidoreductase (luciferase family)
MLPRLGITVPVEDLALTDLPAVAGRAEELGYTDAWSYERNVYDAFTPLAALAPVTRQLRLGTSICNAFTRPAGLIAMSAAALALLAPGRFVLGLGSSTEAIVRGWMGLPFARPLARMRETVSTVRRLLAGEKVGAMKLHRVPEQPVPIYMAALGDRMLQLAGEIADGLVFFMVGPRIAPELQARTGRRMEFVSRIIAIDGDAPEANLTLARRWIASYAVLPIYDRLLARQGFAEEVDAIKHRWQAGDRSGALRQVSQAMVDELILVGDIEAWSDRLAAFQRQGGTPDVWFMSTSAAPDRRRADFERTLRALAPATSRQPV